MTEAIAAITPHLTAAEIDDLCAPLTQRHAQMRHMCLLLDVESLPRRPDGLPLVGRRMAEERLNRVGTTKKAGGFNWSR
ncbi:hypothetical protein [Acidovorax sp. NCPPB 3576]|uniref:hypothetical protein n=1 Tax=Acidovorax sp. NCPPB 3576 TaxID=2940488 RepID=UPI00234A6C51|nr:hypothetical protein [Acidovorax sp. NCPPB 3576]WCM88804.1 hypothetical protein M5C98_01755 [Acidovorax sp. NCPPB 3576]